LTEWDTIACIELVLGNLIGLSEIDATVELLPEASSAPMIMHSTHSYLMNSKTFYQSSWLLLLNVAKPSADVWYQRVL
jgi:hypothetical protein